MKRDLGTFAIDKLILHDVPKKYRGGGEEQPEPDLSEIESLLTPELKNYFQERIATSLGAARFEVVYDPAATSAVPPLIFDNLGSRSRDFVALSREMAQHLHSCQTARNPGGLLTVIEGVIEAMPALAIMKLEKEQGVRINQG